MTEQEKRRWGGKRKGAGRKPEKIRIGRKFSIKEGQKVLIQSQWPEGRSVLRLADVELDGNSRNRTIKLHCDDGETIIIAMMS